MFEVQVLGVQNFMGMEIPVVEGGFGEGKRCSTDKTISEIHGMKVIHIRECINSNRKRFKDNVDIIDLKDIDQVDNNLELLQSLGYSKMQISKAKHIYLLSERGYAKLIKIMDTDLAWEIHDKLMDEYFTMRQQIKQQVVSVEQVTQIATVAAQAAVQAAIAPIMDRLEKLIAPKEAPKTKESKIKTPYSVSKIAKLANMKRNDVNPILRDQKIISGNTRTGWVLNKEYEEAGWGITNENGGQYNGSFVMYSKKGKDAILKILNRVNEQEQLKLY